MPFEAALTSPIFFKDWDFYLFLFIYSVIALLSIADALNV